MLFEAASIERFQRISDNLLVQMMQCLCLIIACNQSSGDTALDMGCENGNLICYSFGQFIRRSESFGQR